MALANTDNHGRNTSVLKHAGGRVELSPLYDFAPMFLDRSGIARVSRWAEDTGFPDWARAAEALGEHGLDPVETRRWLKTLTEPVRQLPETMRDCHVPPEVVAQCTGRIQRVAEALERVPA